MTTAIDMIEGTPFSFAVRFYTDESKTVPYSIAGCNVRFQIRRYENSDSIIGTYTQASPYVSINAALGHADLLIPPSATASLKSKFDPTFEAVIDCWVYNDADTIGIRSALYTINYVLGSARP